jgi:hypothetical protein
MATRLPPFILMVVAIAQVVLTHTGNLTPWKGGGFGMFSTLDHGAYRGITIVVNGKDRSETIDIPPSLAESAARAAAYPSRWLLQSLAAGVFARERRYGRDVRRVTLTAWRTDFDRASLRATDRTLRIFVYVAP